MKEFTDEQGAELVDELRWLAMQREDRKAKLGALRVCVGFSSVRWPRSPGGPRTRSEGNVSIPGPHHRALHAAGVERRPPAACVISRELEVVALVRHSGGDGPDLELTASTIEHRAPGYCWTWSEPPVLAIHLRRLGSPFHCGGGSEYVAR